MKSLLFFLFTSLAANSQTLTPDFGIMPVYTFELEKYRFANSPYVATFHDGNKNLLYLAADHVSVEQYPNLLQHPTFLTIKRIFAENKVDALIIEGLSPWGKNIPQALLDHGNECEKSGYIDGCGEPWFAFQQARHKGAKIMTGEPSDEEILNAVRGQGYGVKDLIGFYIVRQIPAWKREGRFNPKSLRPLVSSQLSFLNKELNAKFNVDDFLTWYSEKTNGAKIMALEVKDTAPVSGSDATAIQKISTVIGVARDRSVVSHIASALATNTTVVVVYGASHFLVERPVLEKMLGKPNLSKTY